MKPIVFTGSIVVFVLFSVCEGNKTNQQAGEGDWLKGHEHQKYETVFKHLPRFEMVMVENLYRYQELYCAGKDQNLEYAAYQAEKMRLAVENGLERRPKIAESAQNFLNIALPQINSAFTSFDTIQFNQAFNALTSHRMVCHAMEEVTFFKVKEPIVHQSAIRK